MNLTHHAAVCACGPAAPSGIPSEAENKRTFPERVSFELAVARNHHGPIFGAHDAYGRILEELDEFWDEVRAKEHKRDRANMLKELIQVAAMAQRAAEDLNLL